MSAYSDQPISLDKDIWQQALVPATNVSRDDDVEIWINSVLVYKIPMGHISYRESKSWVWGNLVLRLSLSLWPFAVPDDGLVELLNAINNHVPVEVKSPFYRNTFVTEHVRFLPGEDMGNYTDCAELELFLNLGM